MTLFLMTILKTLHRGDITYNDITYNWFYMQATLLIALNKNTYAMLHLQMLQAKSFQIKYL